MALILVIILVVLLVGGWPSWGYHQLGYYPSSLVFVLLVVLLVLFLTGKV